MDFINWLSTRWWWTVLLLAVVMPLTGVIIVISKNGWWLGPAMILLQLPRIIQLAVAFEKQEDKQCRIM